MIGDTCVRSESRSVYNGVTDRRGQSKVNTVSVVGFLNAEINDFVHYEQVQYPSHTYFLYSFISLLLCIYIISRNRRLTVVMLTITLLLTFCAISFLLHGVLILFVPERPAAPAVMLPWHIGVSRFAPWFAALCLVSAQDRLFLGVTREEQLNTALLLIEQKSRPVAEAGVAL
ncbi:hypothetical protein GCK32_020445 [Trichostrongylus colubriformis]|uniref:Uncharacterized protein n=1 Tax=Trichostrongylus colubriformis TaxID=6319 RepID=A0AAN8I9S5_TRICO